MFAAGCQGKKPDGVDTWKGPVGFSTAIPPVSPSLNVRKQGHVIPENEIPPVPVAGFWAVRAALFQGLEAPRMAVVDTHSSLAPMSAQIVAVSPLFVVTLEDSAPHHHRFDAA